MSPAEESLRVLIDAVNEANVSRAPLKITGGNSKSCYGRETAGEPLPLSDYRGIVAYEPTELVITARAGTPLNEIEHALEQQGQMLGFEPPRFGPRATLGGTIACGLSGPRRPYAGAVRDFVLGVKCLNGQGEVLTFGGQVMKNVAGFDISRLMAGALGTLGVILEVSLKVLPKPESELTLRQEATPEQAITLMNTWAGQPLPVSATCFDGEALYTRLSGNGSALRAGQDRIGGDEIVHGERFWRELRDHQLPFFTGAPVLPLWRLSVPQATPPLAALGTWLIEWGGGQRWLRTELPIEQIRAEAVKYAGHATLFRGGDRRAEVFSPLPPPLEQLHRRLKNAFDPNRIFNPGRMYSTF
jgi:glycolate oxidase FAD binding subunit